MNYLFFATKNGTVKRTDIAEFTSIRRTGIIALGLRGEDQLSWVAATSGDDEILLVTRQGKSIRFSESDARPMGRTAGGVRGIKIGEDDEVVGMEVIEAQEATRPPARQKGKTKNSILVITEKGYGKKTKITNYPTQSRGGRGVLTARVTEKTGQVAVAKLIDGEEKELLVISAEGKVIKVRLKDVPTMGRATQGVRIMRMDPNDSVTGVA